MTRIALVLALALTALASVVPTALAAPALAPGAWEGTDDSGRLVSFEVDRKRRIVRVHPPGPIPCRDVMYAGMRVGNIFRRPIPVRRGVFRAARSAEHIVASIAGRVAGERAVSGTIAFRMPTGCAYEGRFTARRVTSRVAVPVAGDWAGTDALGSQVLFTSVADETGRAWLVDVDVAGPWDGCGRLRALRGVFPAFSGGSSTHYDRSVVTGRVHIAQRFAGPVGTALDGNRVVGWPGAGDGTTIERTFDGVVGRSQASGTWRTVVLGADGAPLCDSGPVAWSAVPGA